MTTNSINQRKEEGSVPFPWCSHYASYKILHQFVQFPWNSEHSEFIKLNSVLEERWILDKQGCTWEGGKIHTCSTLPLPHNSPVIFLCLFIAKPASLSRLAMHKISFCSPSHIKAPSRYADKSSREWRKLTNPPRLFLLKLAPQPVGSVSSHRTQFWQVCWKLFTFPGCVNSLQTQQEGGSSEFCLFFWNRGGIRVWS